MGRPRRGARRGIPPRGWRTRHGSPRTGWRRLGSGGNGGVEGKLLHLLGDNAAHPDRSEVDTAEAHYRQAQALAEALGQRLLIAHSYLGLGKLYGRTGKREQAQEHLATATTKYREMEMRFWLEQAEAEMTQLG